MCDHTSAGSATLLLKRKVGMSTGLKAKLTKRLADNLPFLIEEMGGYLHLF